MQSLSLSKECYSTLLGNCLHSHSHIYIMTKSTTAMDCHFEQPYFEQSYFEPQSCRKPTYAKMLTYGMEAIAWHGSNAIRQLQQLWHGSKAIHALWDRDKASPLREWWSAVRSGRLEPLPASALGTWPVRAGPVLATGHRDCPTTAAGPNTQRRWRELEWRGAACCPYRPSGCRPGTSGKLPCLSIRVSAAVPAALPTAEPAGLTHPAATCESPST